MDSSSDTPERFEFKIFPETPGDFSAIEKHCIKDIILSLKNAKSEEKPSEENIISAESDCPKEPIPKTDVIVRPVEQETQIQPASDVIAVPVQQEVIIQPELPRTSEIVSQTAACDRNEKVFKHLGVVCTVEEQQFFAYSHDFLVEPYYFYGEDQKKRLKLGQWIEFDGEERGPNEFEIVDYKEIEPPFNTVTCRSDVLVRCCVDIPVDILRKRDQPFNSEISKRVLCKKITDVKIIKTIKDHPGERLKAVLRYVYEKNEPCGYWNLDTLELDGD